MTLCKNNAMRIHLMKNKSEIEAIIEVNKMILKDYNDPTDEFHIGLKHQTEKLTARLNDLNNGE